MRPRRVLLTTSAPATHLFPLVPTAWALRAAGHEVAVAVPPHVVRAVRQAGLSSVSVGPAPERPAGAAKALGRPADPWPQDWTSRPQDLSEEQHGMLAALAGMRLRVAEGMLKELLGFARAWRPDLVVHDAATLAGPAVAAGLGVPVVAQLWGAAAVIPLERERLTGPLLPGYRALFTQAGAEAVTEPALLLDPCPPSLALDAAAPRTPVQPGLYDGPGDVPVPAPSGAPRVCVTWEAGPGGPWQLPPFLTEAARQLAAGGHEVLLPVPDGAQLPPQGLPSGVVPVTGVPPRLLLPSCAAVVHQGGGATTSAAVAAGVPQLVLSPRPEQLVTGARLAAAGAAEHLPLPALPRDDQAAQQLTAAVARLLNPGAADRAAALRAEALAQPTPAQLVPRLIEASDRS